MVYIIILFILILFLIICLNILSIEAFTSDLCADLVIARYNESLSWLSELDLTKFRRIIIYNKGNPLNAITSCDIVNLPNVGRCDHTYLYHIINNYDNLSPVTIFLPGSCSMDSKWDRTKRTIDMSIKKCNSVFIVQRFTNVKNDLYDFKLDKWAASNKENVEINPEQSLKWCEDRPFGKWYAKNFGDIVITGVSYFGIFAVSKEHIHNRNIESYKELIKYLDNHSNPEAGHYFERAWLAVFNKVDSDCLYD